MQPSNPKVLDHMASWHGGFMYDIKPVHDSMLRRSEPVVDLCVSGITDAQEVVGRTTASR